MPNSQEKNVFLTNEDTIKPLDLEANIVESSDSMVRRGTASLAESANSAAPFLAPFSMPFEAPFGLIAPFLSQFIFGDDLADIYGDFLQQSDVKDENMPYSNEVPTTSAHQLECPF